MNELLKVILVTATIYHADPKQTDDTPFITASGAQIEECCPGDHRWIAVSKDLEQQGFLFGVRVKITGTNSPLDGYWVIQDRMHPRWDRRIDFLVDNSITGGKWEDVKIEIVSDREIIHDWPYGRRNPYDDNWR
tara:strand:- start:193 stop:594 length:402 start_codon:yes stop_codon:yes gene_type:complete